MFFKKKETRKEEMKCKIGVLLNKINKDKSFLVRDKINTFDDIKKKYRKQDISIPDLKKYKKDLKAMKKYIEKEKKYIDTYYSNIIV